MPDSRRGGVSKPAGVPVATFAIGEAGARAGAGDPVGACGFEILKAELDVVEAGFDQGGWDVVFSNAALHSWHTPSTWGFLAAGVVLLAGFAWRRRETPEGAFALGVCGSAAVYVLTFVAVGVASDFRYGYWAVLAGIVGGVVVALGRPKRAGMSPER